MTSSGDQLSKGKMPSTLLSSMTTESASQGVLKVIDQMHELNVLPEREMAQFTMTLGWAFGRIVSLEDFVGQILVSSSSNPEPPEEPKKPRFLGDTGDTQ